MLFNKIEKYSPIGYIQSAMDPVISTVSTNNTHYFRTIWCNETYKRGLTNYILKGYEIADRRNTLMSINSAVRRLISQRKNDVEIIKQILRILPAPKVQDDSCGRTNERVQTILGLLNDISSPQIDPQEHRDDVIESSSRENIQSVLDYGCGDGMIIESLGKELHIATENIHGMDLHLEGNQNIQYSSGDVIAIKTGSIDLAIAFVVLHHLGNDPTAHINEIKRVLRPGGVFIIREHDFDGSPEMQAYLHLIHLVVEVKNTGDCSPKIVLRDTIYRSMHEWNEKLTSAGFALKKISKYSGNNPQGLYHAAYVLTPIKPAADSAHSVQ